ncbi:sensor histidine kinase [Mesobacillus zeae]|uniref:histidine kinase n=1 Tax=Mesobacillus zeae TaxID=1917180 RepID=A0A398BBR4_9BACI|nr:HAMP domain-containing sensor histidine kinase [Mesobacillus zeae]RID86278.1 sensor histidine kinase [Mesobacillus zeae]
MGRISIKIGIVFFASIILIEGVLFYFLHSSIIHSRISEELAALQMRGNNHRDVLESAYGAETIHHITAMESSLDTHVVITGPDRKIVASSRPVDGDIQNSVQRTPGKVQRDGRILEGNWKERKYISSVSPLDSGGAVYMFQDTDRVQGLISKLNEHFLLAGTLLVIMMVMIFSFLSKFITNPMIKMNEATKRISAGDYSVTLPRLGKDELGELGESIAVLASDLKHIKKERNEFLASISHELRTPLTYLKGYADIACKPRIDDKDRMDYLRIIKEEASRLSVLVQELFDLAKMDENSFSITPRRTDLNLFLSEIHRKISPSFSEEEMQLELHCPKGIHADIDPARFEQVILNLLDNARKYSGRHTVTKLEAFSRGDNVHIHVSDEGKGIPKEDLPWIFDRFYRVDKSRSKQLGGSGLGLAIARELVEAHGGSISAESELNSGTTFEIILPS